MHSLTLLGCKMKHLSIQWLSCISALPTIPYLKTRPKHYPLVVAALLLVPSAWGRDPERLPMPKPVPTPAPASENIRHNDPTILLFNGGNEKGGDGSKYYRIPALQAVSENTAFAYAEGRPNSSGPGRPGNINMSAKYSHDGGKSWSEVKKISAEHPEAASSDYSDPRAIYDAVNKKHMVIYTQWPDNCAEENACITPDMQNRLIKQEFNVDSSTWDLPVNIDDDLRERSWDARGWGGRASWTYKTSEGENVDAAQLGWTLTSRRKVLQGGSVTEYFSNVDSLQQFVALISLNKNNDLVAEFEGDAGTAVLVKETGSLDFHTTEIKFNPKNRSVDYYFDNKLIRSDWGGSEAGDQNGVYFGNTSTSADGRAAYQSVVFQIAGKTVVSYDSSARLMKDATPEAQGWISSLSGKGDGALGWKALVSGSGGGIQLKWQNEIQGGHNGRLIFPGIIMDAFGEFSVASIYSDDHGKSWHSGVLIQMPHAFKNRSLENANMTESQIVELDNGNLLMTCRNDGTQVYGNVSYGPRVQFTSLNAGITWTLLDKDELRMKINRVNGSLIRYPDEPTQTSDSVLLFSAPIGSRPGAADRYNLGVWSSKDDGESWGGPVKVVNGRAIYSSMTNFADHNIGILVETTAGDITLLSKNIDDLLPTPLNHSDLQSKGQ